MKIHGYMIDVDWDDPTLTVTGTRDISVQSSRTLSIEGLAGTWESFRPTVCTVCSARTAASRY